MNISHRPVYYCSTHRVYIRSIVGVVVVIHDCSHGTVVSSDRRIHGYRRRAEAEIGSLSDVSRTSDDWLFIISHHDGCLTSSHIAMNVGHRPVYYCCTHRVYVVETGDTQRYTTHAGQVTLAGPTIGAGEQRAVDGHGLRGVFDAVGGTEPPVGAPRVGRVGVADGAAGNVVLVAGQHRIEQAHAALVRNAGGDSG